MHSVELSFDVYSSRRSCRGVDTTGLSCNGRSQGLNVLGRSRDQIGCLVAAWLDHQALVLDFSGCVNRLPGVLEVAHWILVLNSSVSLSAFPGCVFLLTH
jgi:hypothetical protein